MAKVQNTSLPPNLEIVKGWGTKAVAAFLAGWFDADGYFGEDAWKLANTHPKTRAEVKELFSRLGFVTSEHGIEVRVCSFQKKMFEDVIGPFSFKKFAKGSHKTSEIPSRVLGVQELGEVQTYDIEVEEVHEFFADGFVSHNSAIWAGLSWRHADVFKFLTLKDWPEELRALKAKDFTFPMPMELTNISVDYDTEFFVAVKTQITLCTFWLRKSGELTATKLLAQQNRGWPLTG